MLQAIILSGFLPRTMARQHLDMPLGRAYLAHWISLIVGAACFLSLLSLYELIGISMIPTELDPTKPAGALAIAGIIFGTEAAFLLLAFILLPWGNARVPARSVWRHSLRTVWLHTGHFTIAALAYTFVHVGSEVVFGRAAHNDYRAQSGLDATLAEIGDWFPYLFPLFFAAALIWYLWALLRAITLVEPGPRAVFPPRCEICGYDLSHHDTSDRCPECGTLVADSLFDGKRGPVAWRFSIEGPNRTTFNAASVQSWSTPEPFFGRVSAYTGLREAGQFLFFHMLLCAAAFFAGFFFPFSILFTDELEFFAGEPMYVFAWAGIAVGLLVGFFVSFIASVIGLINSQREHRNCFGFTLRVACYLAAIFPLWVFSEVAAMVVVVKIVTETQAWRSGYNVDVIMAMGFLLCNVTLIALFATGIIRRLQHIRYANT